MYKVSCPQGNFSETVAKNHEFTPFLFSIKRLIAFPLCHTQQFPFKAKQNEIEIEIEIQIQIMYIFSKFNATTKKYENS